MPTVLITGANRGIGLELARAYAADGWNVIGTCRKPENATDLKAVGGVEIVALDVTDPASVAALAEQLGDRPIDVVLNNAGINHRGSTLSEIDYGNWAETMDANVFGPMRVSEALMANVLAGERKQMAYISSKMGSVAECTGGSYMYRSSKTALNMAVKCLSLEFAPKGVTAVMFHPGHVRTDMGGPSAPVLATESAAGIKSVIDNLKPSDNGRFFNYDGTGLPW
ncbi:SDR family oxidoreductase [Nisaea acidiphila]|uniref:SDR family oxidoreductase n=1 Tax=Nisaea acidiphila TaxID=1862145 RepID=A0A9J7AWT9_9PROT|nr:SDR family oxidoreductase [Nisaea acidiphila]UUX50905.1 SDR family oxidoreductase [Nisaea acidiphila]